MTNDQTKKPRDFLGPRGWRFSFYRKLPRTRTAFGPWKPGVGKGEPEAARVHDDHYDAKAGVCKRFNASSGISSASNAAKR
jgi:hypothetical protein